MDTAKVAARPRSRNELMYVPNCSPGNIWSLLYSPMFAVRVLFFFVALGSWDTRTGTVKANLWLGRLLFYVLDELASLLFFTIYSHVLLFWAELCLIASDSTWFYERKLRPIVIGLNAVRTFLSADTHRCRTTRRGVRLHFWLSGWSGSWTRLNGSHQIIMPTAYTPYSWHCSSRLLRLPSSGFGGAWHENSSSFYLSTCLMLIILYITGRYPSNYSYGTSS